MNHLSEKMAEIIRMYHQKGWSPATSTNYSFRESDDSKTFFVSQSGIDKSEFKASDFMEVDLLGKPTSNYASMKPSAETLIHCKLYELFPDTQVILHSHSIYSVLQSMYNEQAVHLSGYEVLKGFDGITTHDITVNLPIFDNTQDMVAFSKNLEQQRNRLSVPAFIMRKHGTYAWGKTFLEAKRHLEVAEYLFEVEWKAMHVK